MLAGLFTRIRSFTSQIDQTVAEAMNLIKSGVSDVSGARYADVSGGRYADVSGARYADVSGARYADISGARYIDISGANMRISFDVSGSRIKPDMSASKLAFNYSIQPYDISGQNYIWSIDASGTRTVFLPQASVFDMSGQNYTWITDASGSRAVYLPQTNTTTFCDYTPNYFCGNTTVASANWSLLSNRFATLDVSGSCFHNNNSCVCVCPLPLTVDPSSQTPSTTCILNRVPTASGALDDCCRGVCQQTQERSCVGCWRGSCEICMSSVARSNTIDCECPTSPVCGPDVVTKGGCPCYPEAAACPKDGTACCSNDIEDAGLNKTD